MQTGSLKKRLKKAIGYAPSNIALYKQAFTHKSAIPQISARIESNERLEFLGDAVLSLVIGAYLYKEHPHEDEGYLSQMRSRVVNRELFNQLGYKMELQKWMQEVSPNKVEFEESSTMLGNTFEALVGAIFLDKGYEAACHFFEKTVLVYHLNIEDIQASDKNYKSKLLEWGQKHLKIVSYNLIGSERVGSKLQFTIEVTIDGELFGKGVSGKKRKAEQQAAKEAIERLGL